MFLSVLCSVILGLQSLHESGFRGEGMTIAVIDCGFYHANVDTLFPQQRIIGVYDLLREDSVNREDMFSVSYDDHGAHCLSTMLAQTNEFTGTAPDANYILIRTEDLAYEYLGEVDRLERGLWLADELGADIITISLGYSEFDDAQENFVYADMNGLQSVSQTATALARKGRLICVAVGNYGNKPWHYVDIPADADSILTVGACTENGMPAAFSSYGPTADGRQKPEVSAWGVMTRVLNLETGGVEYGSGSSYATPEVAGMAACLWQALPDKSAMEIRDLIIRSASNYPLADDQMGYGVPDAHKAYLLAQHGTGCESSYGQDASSRVQKIMHRGRLYIRRGDVWYDLLGRLIP